MIKLFKYKKSLWIFIIALILMISCFIGMHYYCIEQSLKIRNYTFTKSNLNIPQDGLSLSVTISKSWEDQSLHPDNPMGAQYDGVFTNDSEYTFKNWVAKLVFSEELMIDSSWNGNFLSGGNQITFVATGTPATVEAHNTTTFGAVIYATDLMSLESYTLSGYRIIKMGDLLAFNVLVVISALWLITLISSIIIISSTEVYRKRQELDSKIIMQSIYTLTNFIDAKDTYTKGHSTRVAEYSAEIARRMRMKPQEITQIYYIALMHDCGKIGIPDVVLNKPGKLTNEEYNLIKSHTTIGSDMLQNFTAIPDIRDGAHYHHERFDGKGYPSGLIGIEIPLCARIICVADSFDAMSSNRCYRNGLILNDIKMELEKNAGKQFDPNIVPYMENMIEDGFVEKIQTQYPLTEST